MFRYRAGRSSKIQPARAPAPKRCGSRNYRQQQRPAPSSRDCSYVVYCVGGGLPATTLQNVRVSSGRLPSLDNQNAVPNVFTAAETTTKAIIAARWNNAPPLRRKIAKEKIRNGKSSVM